MAFSFMNFFTGDLFTEPCENKTEEVKNVKEQKPEEEWIWVTGYKGTDADMRCRDFQYEMDKQFDISEDKPVVECEYGFHLCKELSDVYRYYPIAGNNRFFEVKALVRKTSNDAYGTYETTSWMYSTRIDKLAAKSIIFTRELTTDEILYQYIGDGDWTDEEKKLALEICPDEVYMRRKRNRLAELGYSETFARVIINNNKFEIAEAVGSQEGLSMDMKVWTIYNS